MKKSRFIFSIVTIMVLSMTIMLLDFRVVKSESIDDPLLASPVSQDSEALVPPEPDAVPTPTSIDEEIITPPADENAESPAQTDQTIAPQDPQDTETTPADNPLPATEPFISANHSILDADAIELEQQIIEPDVATTPPILQQPVFTESEQSSVLVKPLFSDGTTNIAFYIPYGDENTWVWQSETPAIGDLPFSDYWAPTPAIGKYVAVEYVNDGQQFSCSGLSLEDCVHDPHTINTFNFEISSDQHDQSEF